MTKKNNMHVKNKPQKENTKAQKTGCILSDFLPRSVSSPQRGATSPFYAQLS